jgi:hypothetical protein
VGELDLQYLDAATHSKDDLDALQIHPQLLQATNAT